MSEIIVINGTAFPVPEGSFDIKYENKCNTYESESGHTTVELIREQIASISISYNGLPQSQADQLISKIGSTNTVTWNKNGVETTALFRCKDISTPKKYFAKDGLYVKGLSFTLEEL